MILQTLVYLCNNFPLLVTQTRLTLMQMVGLYQDPEGKMIFSRSHPSQLAITPHKLVRDNNSADSPWKRAQELDTGVCLLYMPIPRLQYLMSPVAMDLLTGGNQN